MIISTSVIAQQEIDWPGRLARESDRLAERRAGTERKLIEAANAAAPERSSVPPKLPPPPASKRSGDLIMVMVDPGAGEQVREQIERLGGEQKIAYGKLPGVGQCPTCQANAVRTIRDVSDGPLHVSHQCQRGHWWEQAS